MKFGLLGFPKVGKTSLFNILTGAAVAVDKYATGRSQPNIGVAKVVDPRVDRLASIFRPKKVTYAQFDFLDVQGIQKGEGRQSVSLAEMRNVDAVAHPGGAHPPRKRQMCPVQRLPRRQPRRLLHDHQCRPHG